MSCIYAGNESEKKRLLLNLFTLLTLKFKKIMNKKDLKFYEAPACEVVELKLTSSILAGSPTGGGSDDIDPDDVDPGYYDKRRW